MAKVPLKSVSRIGVNLLITGGSLKIDKALPTEEDDDTLCTALKDLYGVNPEKLAMVLKQYRKLYQLLLEC